MMRASSFAEKGSRFRRGLSWLNHLFQGSFSHCIRGVQAAGWADVPASQKWHKQRVEHHEAVLAALLNCSLQVHQCQHLKRQLFPLRPGISRAMVDQLPVPWREISSIRSLSSCTSGSVRERASITSLGWHQPLDAPVWS